MTRVEGDAICTAVVHLLRSIEAELHGQTLDVATDTLLEPSHLAGVSYREPTA